MKQAGEQIERASSINNRLLMRLMQMTEIQYWGEHYNGDCCHIAPNKGLTALVTHNGAYSLNNMDGPISLQNLIGHEN
jgi:hypothetical protein